ncbi:MAG TPA: FadR family transcriptional regulator [Candidatus Avipropionibacterium avicola]|uniref:FadR family transcriptional regulator n=1 Tax=Candidatus Avipropionibacterium avicola TaxID=2840701 RepID=A0A9D1GXP2_9ACTN|nr:FadR family transcriptional regulator [Candidatus Avipropionibacterium avicola]
MTTPPPDPPAAVTDSAIGKIKAMITSGELAPGDRLPPEAVLADRLGLSRSSLREAVKGLSLMGVLAVRQGAGTYVTSLKPALLMGAMEFVVDFHRDDTVLHFLEVRRILEPAATALAANRMDEADFDELEDHLAALGTDPGVEELVASDLEFHRRIVQASGNPVLAALIDSFAGPLQRARVWRGTFQEGALDRTQREHRAILSAMRSRNHDIVIAASTMHICGVEQWLRQYIADGGRIGTDADAG